jgi:hypothetical protein
MRIMNPASKTNAAPIVIWSLVWALGIIAIAFFFEGNPARNWIDAALYFVGTLAFLALIPGRIAFSRP